MRDKQGKFEEKFIIINKWIHIVGLSSAGTMYGCFALARYLPIGLPMFLGNLLAAIVIFYLAWLFARLVAKVIFLAMRSIRRY